MKVVKRGYIMFDRIIYISDDSCQIKLKDDAQVTTNLMNLHLDSLMSKQTNGKLKADITIFTLQLTQTKICLKALLK